MRGDPMLGTAFPASRLLLVEQPGPWGRAGTARLPVRPGSRASADRRSWTAAGSGWWPSAGRAGRWSDGPRRWAPVGLPARSRTVGVGALRRRRRSCSSWTCHGTPATSRGAGDPADRSSERAAVRGLRARHPRRLLRDPRPSGRRRAGAAPPRPGLGVQPRRRRPVRRQRAGAAVRAAVRPGGRIRGRGAGRRRPTGAACWSSTLRGRVGFPPGCPGRHGLCAHRERPDLRISDVPAVDSGRVAPALRSVVRLRLAGELVDVRVAGRAVSRRTG